MGKRSFSVSRESAEKRLQDAEGHFPEGLQLLVSMDPAVHVHLRERFDSFLVIDVQEMSQLHPVSHGERESFQKLSSPRVLPAQRLHKAGELGIEERKKGTHEVSVTRPLPAPMSSVGVRNGRS